MKSVKTVVRARRPIVPITMMSISLTGVSAPDPDEIRFPPSRDSPPLKSGDLGLGSWDWLKTDAKRRPTTSFETIGDDITQGSVLFSLLVV